MFDFISRESTGSASIRVWQRRAAQVFNRLYRRFPIGSVACAPAPWGSSRARRLEALRNRRLEVCATRHGERSLTQLWRWRYCSLAGLLLAVLSAQAQPVFFREPVGQSVSLCTEPIILYGEACGAGPIAYQWRKNGLDLSGQTMEVLILNPARVADSGNYELVATDFTGSVTSQVATLTVDSTFTKITADPVVGMSGGARGGAFADFDNDGYADLFVVCFGSPGNRLFRNNRDGTFTQMTNAGPAREVGYSYAAAWGDANNDGSVDLFVANYGYPFTGQSDFFYVNKGDGGFLKVTNGPMATNVFTAASGAWADVDNDGQLDLFVVNQFRAGQAIDRDLNLLCHNNGDGSFAALADTAGNEEPGGFIPPTFTGACFADYDNDGRLDLFLGRDFIAPYSAPGNYTLYRNLGSNRFARVASGPIAGDTGHCSGGAWGDYDNDGWLDLFVPNGLSNPFFGSITNEASFLYHNNGDGTFTKVTNGVIANHIGQC
jgi:hypothetical protein